MDILLSPNRCLDKNIEVETSNELGTLPKCLYRDEMFCIHSQGCIDWKEWSYISKKVCSQIYACINIIFVSVKDKPHVCTIINYYAENTRPDKWDRLWYLLMPGKVYTFVYVALNLTLLLNQHLSTNSMLWTLQGKKSIDFTQVRHT